MIKEIKTPPKDGTCFLMTWDCNDMPWSRTCRYGGSGEMEEYVEYDPYGGGIGGFMPSEPLCPTVTDIQYFTISEDCHKK